MSSALIEHESYVKSADKLIVAVEDEWGIWPSVRQLFESRTPLQSVSINNKFQKTLEVEELPLQYILTSDPVLKKRPPSKNSPHWFRHPYATVVLLNCEDLEDYRINVRPKLQRLVQGEWREWLIVHIMRSPANDSTGRIARRVYGRIEDHFRKDRCCKLELSSLDSEGWVELENKLVECIRTTVDVRLSHYEQEAQRLWKERRSEQRNVSSFFVDSEWTPEAQPSGPLSFFLIKESMAFMLQMVHLKADALREYEELESFFLEAAKDMAETEFGGNDRGDAMAALLNFRKKPFTKIVQAGGLKAFDYLQYLFARQTSLLLELGRVDEVSQRAVKFIFSFCKELRKRERDLPVCLGEMWAYSGCTSVGVLCQERFVSRSMSHPHRDRDFHRHQGTLFALARKKEELVTPNPYFIGPKEDNLPSSSHPYYARLASLSPENAQVDLLVMMSALHSSLAQLAEGSELVQSLFSLDSFQERLMELSKLAADSFVRCSWRRHGLSMDAEVASLLAPRQRAISAALKLYERLAVFLETEKWSPLLMELQPSLLSCQEKVGNLPGQVHALARWLTVDPSLVPDQQKRDAQDKILEISGQLAGYLENPQEPPGGSPGAPLPESVNLDVSSILSFSGEASWNLPVEVGEGDDAELAVLVWSGFPKPWKIHSLKLHLVSAPSFSVDQGLIAKCTSEIVEIPPGVSTIPLSITLNPTPYNPDPQGVYFLGSLTANLAPPHFGQPLKKLPEGFEPVPVKLRSQSAMRRAGPLKNEFFFTAEKPLRPYLKALPPRPWAEINAFVSQGLLLSLPQFVGLKIKPLFSPLPPSTLSLSTGPSFSLLSQQICLQILPQNFDQEALQNPPESPQKSPKTPEISPRKPTQKPPEISPKSPQNSQILEISSLNGTVKLPSVPEGSMAILWVKVEAIPEETPVFLGKFLQPTILASPSHSQELTLRSTPSSPIPPVPRGGSEHSSVSAPYLRPQGSGPVRGGSLTSRPSLGVGGGGGGGDGEGKGEIGGQSGGEELTPTLEGLRILHVKLETSRKFLERSVGFNFHKPFRVQSRLVSRSPAGELLLQVTLTSQVVNASLAVDDVSLVLQRGLEHSVGGGGKPGRPIGKGLPMVLAPEREGSFLFALRLSGGKEGESWGKKGGGGGTEDGLDLALSVEAPEPESVLQVEFRCQGSPLGGAHYPPKKEEVEPFGEAYRTREKRPCTFSHSFSLQAPVSHRVLAVGLLPSKVSAPPRMGSLIVFQWKVERLIPGGVGALPLLKGEDVQKEEEEIEYEIKFSAETWMLSGRKTGYLTLGLAKGSAAFVSVSCLPVVPGHIHPPMLRLPGVHRSLVTHSPAGPHLMHVLPPHPSTALCIKKVVVV